uniref:DUF4806 domain-containing protein n=1 Tax=Strongyloides venezuelensis TaxID=75913 RepID=A0A0K0F459_STRVS
MRARSDSAIIRARYSSEVSGVNRFRHFHTPIVLSNKPKNNSDMPSHYENLPLLEKKIKKSSRVLLDIAKPCQECGETSQKDNNSYLPCLILHPKNRHISRDIVTVASDINTYKHKSTPKSFCSRSNIPLSEDSLASNRTTLNASDYESGISKSSSFSNNSSILSPNSNLTNMELTSYKIYSSDVNSSSFSKITKADPLPKVSNSKTVPGEMLSRKINFLNNVPISSSNDGLSIDKMKSKSLNTRQGKRKLKNYKYEMKSFSSDNLIVSDGRTNHQYNVKNTLNEIGTQTDKVRFKKDKNGPKKQKKKKKVDGSFVTSELSVQTELSNIVQITKAVQTSFFLHDKGKSYKNDADYADEYYHVDLFNEFTKTLSEAIDRQSVKYLSHQILTSIKEKGDAWRDAKTFVSTVLIPQSVLMANKTHYGHKI